MMTQFLTTKKIWLATAALSIYSSSAFAVSISITDGKAGLKVLSCTEVPAQIEVVLSKAEKLFSYGSQDRVSVKIHGFHPGSVVQKPLAEFKAYAVGGNKGARVLLMKGKDTQFPQLTLADLCSRAGNEGAATYDLVAEVIVEKFLRVEGEKKIYGAEENLGKSAPIKVTTNENLAKSSNQNTIGELKSLISDANNSE